MRRLSYTARVALISSAIFIASAAVFSSAAAEKELPVYKDTKNGYFLFSPPQGWRIQAYEDPRTKVAFHHPTEDGVHIRIIVREAPQETLADIKANYNDFAQMLTSKGIAVRITETECLGVRAMQMSYHAREGPNPNFS